MASKWALKQRAIQPRLRPALNEHDKPIVSGMSMRPYRHAEHDVLKRHGMPRSIRRSFG